MLKADRAMQAKLDEMKIAGPAGALCRLPAASFCQVPNPVVGHLYRFLLRLPLHVLKRRIVVATSNSRDAKEGVTATFYEFLHILLSSGAKMLSVQQSDSPSESLIFAAQGSPLKAIKSKLLILALAFVLGSLAQANSIPEPGLIHYGAVTNSANGNARVTIGHVSWSVHAQGGGPLTLVTPLENINGLYSYSLRVPFESVVGGNFLSSSVFASRGVSVLKELFASEIKWPQAFHAAATI